MHVVIEFWKAQTGWFRLSAPERAEYLASVAPAIQGLFAEGVRLLAIEAAEGPAGRHPEYDYWAVWQVPHEDHVAAIGQALQKLDWNAHFEAVPLDVEGRSLEDILGSTAASPH